MADRRDRRHGGRGRGKHHVPAANCHPNGDARRQKTEEFHERFANPFIAAEHGFIDDVIEPHEAARPVIQALRMLETKVDTMPRKKHGNIPL